MLVGLGISIALSFSLHGIFFFYLLSELQSTYSAVDLLDNLIVKHRSRMEDIFGVSGQSIQVRRYIELELYAIIDQIKLKSGLSVLMLKSIMY